jgi:hypothetical protein
MKPNINSYDVHPQLGNDSHQVNGAGLVLHMTITKHAIIFP